MHDYEYDEPDGMCRECGLELDDDPAGDHDENHRLCWDCWRAENDPAPFPVMASVADRRWERLMARMSDIERRLDQIERGRAVA